jgi:DNA polymerase
MINLSKLNLLVLDFETFLDRKVGYDLKKISVTEYIRDQRFKVHGCGVQWVGLDGSLSEAKWIKGPGFFENEYLGDLPWNKVAVIAHNVKFDGAILAWKYGVKPALWIDTKAMSMALLGNSVPNHSLRYLAEHFGLQRKGEMKTDGLRDLTPAEEAELASYCKTDVEICAQLFEIFRKDFPASQYEPMDWTIRAFVEPKLQINVPLIQEEHEKEKQRREGFFVEGEKDKKEFASNQKFAALLGAKGYEVPTKVSPRTGKRIPALALGDTEFLELLESEDRDLRELCEARIAAKSTLKETRSAKFAKVGATGPWPFDVQFSGAMQTHRYSGGAGAGGNPQNLTRGSVLRQCIEAPEGYRLLVVDFSAVERRIQSWLACDQVSVDAFMNDKDIYCQFASRFFGRTITKADKPQRQFGKTSELGLGYGMGPDKFIRQVKVQTGETIDRETSRKAVRLFRTTYTGITNYWDYLDRLLFKIAAGETGKLNGLNAVTYDKSGFTLPSGLKLKYTNLRREGKDWLFDRYDKGKLVQKHIYGAHVFEHLCQSLAGDMCKEAIQRVENLGLDVKGQVHDEAIVVVPEADAEDAQIAVEREFSRSPAWWPGIKLAAECNIGKNWLEGK